MLDELMSLINQEITQQQFNEKLALHRHRFNTELNTKVRDMLPDRNLPNIGNGYLSNLIEDDSILFHINTRQ